jgi:hypothetical protein
MDEEINTSAMGTCAFFENLHTILSPTVLPFVALISTFLSLPLTIMDNS